MNNRKQLLLAIFAVVFVSPIFTEDNVNTPEQQEEIAELFATELYPHYDKKRSAFDECIRTNSDDCALVIAHLKKARDYRKNYAKDFDAKEGKIAYLSDLRADFIINDDMEAAKNVENDLDKAINECPDCFKSYWKILPESEQNKLTQAAYSIIYHPSRPKEYITKDMKMLKKSLDRKECCSYVKKRYPKNYYSVR